MIKNPMHMEVLNYSTDKEINRNIFVDLCQETAKVLSKDELENLFLVTREESKKTTYPTGQNYSVFNLIANYAGKFLENDGENVKCRYKELLKWRDTTLYLDQDMFISAHFAYCDVLSGRKRVDFSWDVVTKSNNIRIHNMLSQGMADNHFHLLGSAPTFKLSWLNLMNNVKSKEELKLDERVARLDKGHGEYTRISNLLTLAQIIRVVLFYQVYICKKYSEFDKIYQDLQAELIMKTILEYDKENKITKLYDHQIQSEISVLNTLLNGRSKDNIDYCLINQVRRNDSIFEYFSGERFFMYKCFKAIFTNDKDFMKYADLFYAYLVIKNTLRKELIQANNRVGFSNFSDYQDRKQKFLRGNRTLKDFLPAQAILMSVKRQNVVSIEARICPDKDMNKNIKTLCSYDSQIINELCNDASNYWIDKRNFNTLLLGERYSIAERNFYEHLSNDTAEEKKKIDSILKEHFFYVFHFPKCIDKKINSEDTLTGLMYCRHYEHRKELKQYAKAIAKMREQNRDISSRVLGIDACSNELIERPEVFGQAFRYLKGHIPNRDFEREFCKEIPLPRLRATYHVGEDFLDVADGLRAIEEAILFLELTHGDRLGHAIVLGIDIEEWYKNKGNHVNLSKQDLLDNVAWTIKKLKEYTIINSSEYIDKLQEIYNDYYSQIYMTGSDWITKDIAWNRSNNEVMPVDLYILAWHLRGDNPKTLYDYTCAKDKEGFSQNNDISYWDRRALREDKKIRRDNTITALTLRYHYDAGVKQEGSKKVVFKVPKYLINALKAIQLNMQREVRERGIGIECNPTSNVLISTFKRFDNHPILNFNNLGLEARSESMDKAQLFVSINTDDQGVFDTILENEYALMALALEKVKDENGMPVYNQTRIFNWLDSVRRMGLEQCFNFDYQFS
jgi:hypothetical protein